MFAQGSECQMIKSKQIELRVKHAFHVKSGNMCGSKFGAYKKMNFFKDSINMFVYFFYF